MKKGNFSSMLLEKKTKLTEHCCDETGFEGKNIPAE